MSIEILDEAMDTKTIIGFFPTGSNYMCDPPVTSTDIDYAILVNDTILDCGFVQYLGNLGFSIDGNDSNKKDDGNNYPDSNFISMRRDNYNFIMFCNKNHYERFHLATEKCKELNLLLKGNRVALFEMICKF